MLVAKRIVHDLSMTLVQSVRMTANSIDPFVGVTAELQMAVNARSSGNEGKARVCARRAAGWAVRGWRERRGIGNGGQSAHQHLQGAALDRKLPPHIRAAAAHLIMRIDENHELPIGADVLDDARVLVNFFFDA